MSRTIPKLPPTGLIKSQNASTLKDGDIFRHHSGDHYQVHSLAHDCKTNELRVNYSKLYDTLFKDIMFSRPEADFREPRFIKVMELVKLKNNYNIMNGMSWLSRVDNETFIDYDGSGDWLRINEDGAPYKWDITNNFDLDKDYGGYAYPSDRLDYAPIGVTHINWCNR